MTTTRATVIGRDAREWYAAAGLARRGWDVVYVGPPPVRGAWAPGGPSARGDLSGALSGRHLAVGSIRGLSDEQDAAVRDQLHTLAPVARLLVGRPGEALRRAAGERGHRVTDLLQHDALLRLNAVPTAEGAIVEAVTASQRTIWQSRCTVIGYGRVGQELGARLRALGADVTVAARAAAQRAAARAAGSRALPISAFAEALAGVDFVFNTVAAPVFSAAEAAACPERALLIDLASPPGGFDRDAVERRGLQLRWPLGIPGRLTPRTAGTILADVIADLVEVD